MTRRCMRGSVLSRAVAGLAAVFSPLWAFAAEAVAEAASGAASGAASSIPFRATGGSHAPAPSEWGLAVFACAALLMVLLVVLKRYGRQLSIKGFGTKEIQILEKTPLGPSTSLVMVAYRGRRLLLATGATHTQCLRDDPLDADAEVGSGPPRPGGGGKIPGQEGPAP